MAAVLERGRSVFRLRLLPAALVVFVTAVAARLVPLLRGGGLRGYGSYDDSVYFAATLGWLHGRWPYRDFLFLQPPGVIVVLSPSAALARWFGDSGGLAAARMGWIVAGGLTTVGLLVLLWRTSRVAAVVAGLFYAVSWPAAMVERLTDLEGPQNLLLVSALVLLRLVATDQQPPDHVASDQVAPDQVAPSPPGDPEYQVRVRQLAVLAAGLALGLACSIKIWEVAPIVVLTGWLAVARRFRDLAWFSLGVVAALSAVCLPFFLTARRQMWTMVVADQLHRPRHPGWAKRLVFTTGTTHLLPIDRIGVGLITVLVIIAVALVLAWRRPIGRLIAILYLVALGVLLQSPPTYVHYGSFVAPMQAMLLGLATSEGIRLCHRIPSAFVGRLVGGTVAAAVSGMLVLLAYAPATAIAGHPPPAGRLDAITDDFHGCISYDEPSQALSLDLVSRDLDRGCPFVVDLGAASGWNRLRLSGRHPSHTELIALDYLRNASASLLFRYPPGRHGDSVNIPGHWTLLARDHRIRLVAPRSGGSGPS